MKIEKQEIVFSSGKRRAAWSNMIGLSTDFEIGSGSDDSVYIGPGGEEWRPPESRLNSSELIELAEYMIDLWSEFKAKVEAGEIS